MPMAAPKSAREMAAPPAPPPEMIEEFAEATETVSGIAVYELPKKVTIPSDNEKHPITLIEEDLESETIHYWYAEGMAEVVAQDKVVNNDSVILPGKMKVFSEGDYIGETSVGQISPREEFKIGTRVAYDVKAEKKLIEKDTEKAGITRGKQKRGYKYSLEIKSFARREITVKVVDIIPHSNSEKITVEIPEPTLPYKKMELGVIEWETKLAAGAETKIGYSYEVEWERDVLIRPPLP